MNAHTHVEDRGNTLIDVDSTPLALQLPVGAAVFAVQGDVWLTQEGRYEDVILAPGARFDVTSRKPIVVSAIVAPAGVYIARPVGARAPGPGELHDHLRQKANQMREQEIDRLAGVAAGLLKSLAARALAMLRPRPAPTAARGAQC